jgi:hypothetical protein
VTTRRLGQWGAVLTDVLQAAIGCVNHRYMAPSQQGIHPAASLAYLLYGSTFMWLHCYTAFSFLPFPLELLKAALCCMVLLASSPHLCATSWGLRAGYATLHAGVTRAAQPLLAALQPALRAAAPLVVAAGSAGGASVPAVAAPAWHCLTWWRQGPAVAAAAASGQSQQNSDVAACLQYQTPVLLLFGFVASTWAVHRAERCMRTKFLLSCCGRQQEEGQGAAAAAAQPRAGGSGAGAGSPPAKRSRFPSLLCPARHLLHPAGRRVIGCLPAPPSC